MVSIEIRGGGEGRAGHVRRVGDPRPGRRWTGGCVDAKIEGRGFAFARVGFCLEILRRAIQGIFRAEECRQDYFVGRNSVQAGNFKSRMG